jgi:hypothetical protein
MSLNPEIDHQRPSSVELHHPGDSYDAFWHISPFQVEAKKNSLHSQVQVQVDLVVEDLEDHEEHRLEEEDLCLGVRRQHRGDLWEGRLGEHRGEDRLQKTQHFTFLQQIIGD